MFPCRGPLTSIKQRRAALRSSVNQGRAQASAAAAAAAAMTGSSSSESAVAAIAAAEAYVEPSQDDLGPANPAAKKDQ